MNEVIYVEKRPDTLYHYSERKWLECSLYEGVFRLSSASYIESLEEDAPRQDDEMRMEHSIPKENIVMSCERAGRRSTPIYDLTSTDEIVTDYYMLCLTTKKSKYMFDEFKGPDSYLIIHDTEEFSCRGF